MVTVFAAHRYRRVYALWAGAGADAAAAGTRIGAGHGPTLADVTDRAVRLELAAALRVSEHAAGRLLHHARALCTRFPRLLDLLDHAATTVGHVEFLVDELDPLDAPVRERVLDQAVDWAQSLPIGPFRRAVRRVIDTTRADSLAQRHRAALAQRRVCVEPAGDGMAWLATLAPEVEVRAIHHRLTALGTACASPDDDRTLDQRRADVFCDLLIDGQVPDHPEHVRGIRATVTVTVPALTLLGHPDTGPAIIDGIAPIPRDRARELCGGATGWTRILTHPETGTVLSVGRTQYRPPADLQRYVRTRHPRCVAPGCGMPAHRCDLDHTLAWEHGGHTSANNLAPLCKGHHTVKHHTNWQIRQLPDRGGTIEWTSPAGRRYLVEPERRTPHFPPTHPTSITTQTVDDPPPF